MSDLELKRERIEKIVKVLGLGVAGFFVAPFIFIAIKGLIGLTIAAVVGLLLVNVGVPWFAVKIANWRLKALKYEASLNPIETLENQYDARANALNAILQNLKEFYAVVEELAQQIKEHNERYPDRPSQFQDKYLKMKALYVLRSQKYKQAKKNLSQFWDMIDEKRSDWKVAQSAAKAMKIANIGEDFQSKLMQDAALSSIQDGLNMAFSELEVSLLENDDQSTTTVVTSPVKAIADKEARTIIKDVTFDLEEAERMPRQVAAAN